MTQQNNHGDFLGTLPATTTDSGNNGHTSAAITWYQGLSPGDRQQVDAEIVSRLGENKAFQDAWRNPAKRWKHQRVQQVVTACYAERHQGGKIP